MPGSSGRDIEVFTESVQLPIEERVAFLDQAFGEDKDLRHKIEAWLKSNDWAGSFLEEPPEEAMARKALQIRRKLFGMEHVDVADSLRNVSIILGGQDRWREAKEIAFLVIDLAAKVFEFLLAVPGEILAISDMGRIKNKRN